MILFLIGLLLGGLAGVIFMALFQINKSRHYNMNEMEAKDDE